MTRRVRKQKTDRQDVPLILQLMLEGRFPQIWVASWENRDLRQPPAYDINEPTTGGKALYPSPSDSDSSQTVASLAFSASLDFHGLR